MKKNDKLFITNHESMTGAAILHRLETEGFTNLVTGTPAKLDLRDQKTVSRFFIEKKPDYVFLTSVKVGGILANSRYPARFIYDNIQAQTNVIHTAWKSGVKKLLFLGSSCVYPKSCPQPIKEKYLLTGELEPTSEPYAIAKIAGIKMCQAYNFEYGAGFISAIPADLYGPRDDFNPETGHVLPALISKMHRARTLNEQEVTVWGTGSPRRETLHVDDLADACIILMNDYEKSEMVNIGSGEDISIKELASLIKEIIGYQGKIVFDESKPDGSPRKLLDNTRIRKLGWVPRVSLEIGIRQTCQWYENHIRIK